MAACAFSVAAPCFIYIGRKTNVGILTLALAEVELYGADGSRILGTTATANGTLLTSGQKTAGPGKAIDGQYAPTGRPQNANLFTDQSVFQATSATSTGAVGLWIKSPSCALGLSRVNVSAVTGTNGYQLSDFQLEVHWRGRTTVFANVFNNSVFNFDVRFNSSFSSTLV